MPCRPRWCGLEGIRRSWNWEWTIGAASEPSEGGAIWRSGDNILGFLLADNADGSMMGGTTEEDAEDVGLGIEPDAARRSELVFRGPDGGILPLTLPDQLLVGPKPVTYEENEAPSGTMGGFGVAVPDDV